MFNLLNKTKFGSLKRKGNIDFIIAGLGNPGPKYEFTRHNAGFLTIDYIAKNLGVSIERLKYKSLIVDTYIDEHRVILIKPQTFMNLSGTAVEEITSFYKIPPEKVIVIYDDISLEPGKLRIRRKGSAGGHNGIKSIIESIVSDNFPRIKLGVGAPTHGYDLASWVTSEFSKSDFEKLSIASDNAYKALKLMISGKTDEAMNKFNS